jgi:hypothetical protein
MENDLTFRVVVIGLAALPVVLIAAVLFTLGGLFLSYQVQLAMSLISTLRHADGR